LSFIVLLVSLGMKKSSMMQNDNLLTVKCSDGKAKVFDASKYLESKEATEVFNEVCKKIAAEVRRSVFEAPTIQRQILNNVFMRK
jgi:hypothetical protein